MLGIYNSVIVALQLCHVVVSVPLSLLLHDPEAAPLHATLSTMDSSELWQEDVLCLARERREGLCVLYSTDFISLVQYMGLVIG